MLTNYLKIAFRSLLRHRTYSLLNIIGLAVGLTCGILIFLVVGFQLRFDAYHPKADRIYRIVTDLVHENTSYSRGTPKPLAEVLRREYPFLETVARIKRVRSGLLSVPNTGGGYRKKFQEERTIGFAEPQLFDAFDFQWKYGSPQTALAIPNSVVLTEKYVRKYFGDANPIGQTLRLDNHLNLTVRGVLKDHPVTTNLSDEVYISYTSVAGLGEWAARSLQDWEDLNSEEMTFVALPAGRPVEQLEAVFPAIVQKYYNPENAGIYHFRAQPLNDVHFNVNYGGRMQKKLLYAMATVGLFLIVAACINFVNMATAQALRRSKEVGVRKAMGSTRSQLFRQFMFETALITGTAVVVALGLSQTAIPLVNKAMAVFNANLLLWDLAQPKPLALLVLLIGCVIGMAGFYPSLVLSGFSPMATLRRKMTTEQVGGISVRRGLVVGQFFMTQLFVISVIVIMSQLRYIQNADLGFTKETVLTIPVSTPDPLKQQTLRNRLKQLETVQEVALGNAPPASSIINQATFTYENRAEPENFEARTKIGDRNYLPLFDLKLLAGSNFRTDDTVSKEVIVNEMMVKRLGLKDPNEILSKRIRIGGGDRTVVGVVKDFHVNSLRMAVAPTVIFKSPAENQMAALKISPDRLPETVKQVEAIWNELFPEQVFYYQFMDEVLDRFYTAETIMLGFVQVFSAIAILIGCLGLYGLVSFMAESKTKEIGVRKVLGATVGQILWLFGREFGRLILLGFALAAPVGWWLMRTWLQDYTYRIQLEWWMFGATALVVTCITLVTVSVRSYQSASMNPVKSLRSE
ncbi:ABC transporter permease [Larkinella harenae]